MKERTAIVSSEELRSWLLARGWKQIDDSGRAGDTWVLPHHADAPALLVPRDRADRHYNALIESALQSLAWVEKTGPDDLAEAILTESCDTLEIRVMDPATKTGRIPLRRGAHLADALYEIILNGLRVRYLGPRAAYRGPLPDKADQVLESFEMAAPSPGSFRMEVVAPATPQLAIDVAAAPESEQRQSLRAALDAVRAIRSAASDEPPSDPDQLDDAVGAGLSSNLLKALGALDTQSTALVVEVSACWAGTERNEDDVVRFEARHFARVPRLRDVLSQFLPRENFSLTGWIKAVHAQGLASEDQPLAGTVTVEARIDGQTRNVVVELEGTGLKNAAAGLGDHFVTAVGTLERIQRRWHLTGVRDLKIREDPTPD